MDGAQCRRPDPSPRVTEPIASTISLPVRSRRCKGFVYDLAVQLGRVGVWQGGYGPTAADDRAMISELETLGYGAFWFGEAPGGKEAFTRAATLLAASSTIAVGTGIASVWGRDPLNVASAIRTVGEAFPGRFVAGLGVSHPPAVQARGETYRRPFSLIARSPPGDGSCALRVAES